MNATAEMLLYASLTPSEETRLRALDGAVTQELWAAYHTERCVWTSTVENGARVLWVQSAAGVLFSISAAEAATLTDDELLTQLRVSLSV